MSFLGGILTDLREKRLWPVALGLLVALVAVPMLLSSRAKTTPVAEVPPAGPVAPPATAVPAVSITATPGHSRLTGRARDPFKQQQQSKTTTTTATTSSTAGKGAATTASSTSGSSGSNGATRSGGTGVATTPTTTTRTTTTTTTTTPPTVTPKSMPTGLTVTQSYHVIVSITNPAGGVDTIDPLERLSPLPSKQEPLLVELGVLKGGHRVLFVVQPGTVVSGPGTCTPGPIDCEILSLGSDQIESLSTQSATGVVAVAQFAVTAITADGHPSAAAADKARRMESAAGRRLLSTSTLSALSLFQYEPSLGAVVDLRNLTVGGS
jgi:hypothetical protein